MRPQPELLLITNGHGEDEIAARVVTELLKLLPELTLEAYPLVGRGERLQRAGLNIAGPTRRLPSGGLTLHAPSLLLKDLRAGLLPLTYRQARYLRGRRPGRVLVVGDVYAQLHASLVRAPRRVLQPLISVHHAPPASARGGSSPLRYFMEQYRRPELRLLKRAERVYARDQATAHYLQGEGVAGATCLGNPMMDALSAEPLEAAITHPAGRVVALLPGSREHAGASLPLMLEALTLIGPALGLVAWALERPPRAPSGWSDSAPTKGAPGAADAYAQLASWRHQKSGAEVWVLSGAFAAVLATASAAIGTAGTGNEQAVGSGLPVVTFPVPPHYSSAFLNNQARLLGDGLLVAEPDAAAIAAQLKRALLEEPLRERARRAGALRMGPPGASAKIAADLAEWLAPTRLAE